MILSELATLLLPRLIQYDRQQRWEVYSIPLRFVRPTLTTDYIRREYDCSNPSHLVFDFDDSDLGHLISYDEVFEPADGPVL